MDQLTYSDIIIIMVVVFFSIYMVFKDVLDVDKSDDEKFANLHQSDNQENTLDKSRV